MTQLRKSSMMQIHDTLEESAFGVCGFQVSYPDAKNGPVSKIVFLGDPQFSFSFDRKFTTTFSPGSTFATTTYENRDFSDVIADLKSWTLWIEEELKAQLPIYHEFEEFRRMLEEKLDAHVEDPESHFSEQDLEELRLKMDDMRSTLEELQKKNQLTEEQVKQANYRIKRLEELAKGMTKKDWLRTTINALYSLLRSFGIPSLGKQIATKYAMRLLGSDENEPPMPGEN